MFSELLLPFPVLHSPSLLRRLAENILGLLAARRATHGNGTIKPDMLVGLAYDSMRKP